MYKILVVEDDPIIAGAVTKELIRWGLEAKAAEDFSNIRGEFVHYAPHLVILDISLPFFNGYYWCQEIRKISEAPIYFCPLRQII